MTMSLNPAIVHQAFVSCRSAGGFSFGGMNFDRMSLGISNGLCQWGLNQPGNLSLSGTASGTAGNGIINPATTALSVPPESAVVSAALSGAGMAGPLGQSLAIITALAISQAFSMSGQYYGTAAGVGVGTDVSKVSVSNAATLIVILNQSLAAILGSGPALPIMATGLGNGIASLLLLGTGTGFVNGPSFPGPGFGPTTSVVV